MKVRIQKKKEPLHVWLVAQKTKVSREHAFLQKAWPKAIFGKAKEKLFVTPVTDPLRTEVYLGIGEARPLSYLEAGGEAVRVAKQQKAERLSIGSLEELDIEAFYRLVEGVILGNYKFTMKSKKEGELKEVTFFLEADNEKKRALKKAEDVCAGTLLTRDLANLPANVCTPKFLVEQARKIAKRNEKISCTVIDKDRMKKLGMHAFLGVASGSVQPPYLILLEYKGSPKAPVAVVGKGITFDSGGISLKPAQKMDEMKFDMSGAAVVLGLFEVLARQSPPVHVIGAAACTENLPSGSAQKPGDIVSAYSGKTIEILNTDAEGRLVLADTLSFVEKKFKPEAIVDLATLTGACIVALGHHCAGLLGTEEALLAKLKESGERVGERLWQLPLWKEYEKEIESKVADVANISMRGAGTITAGAFLKQFVEKTPWAHIDIAGVAWDVKDKSYIPHGATGFGVRLLYDFLTG